MKKKIFSPQLLSSTIEAAFYFFLFLFFTLLTAESLTQNNFRLILGAVIAGVFCIYLLINFKIVFRWNWGLTFLSAFIAFQLLRAGWASYTFAGSEAAEKLLFTRYLKAPVFWSLPILFFALSSWFFNERGRSLRLLNSLTVSAIFLVFNALPALLARGKTFYLLKNGGDVFFMPSFYFHDWVSRYFLGTFAPPNAIGDLMMLGFFPALGLGIYAIFIAIEEKSRDAEMSFPLIASALLRFMWAGMIAASVLLILSRGTIALAGLFTVIFMAVLCVKYRNLVLVGATILIFSVMAGFLAWSGGWERAWKEVSSLSVESAHLSARVLKRDAPQASGSIGTNFDGARRAKEMYFDHPILGVGTRGYKKVSKQYPGPEPSQPVKKSRRRTVNYAEFTPLSFYWQILAEEGAGAYLYFIFLIWYFYTIAKGLFAVRSRFQFIAALSLAAGISMVFAHASFNSLMNRSAMLVPVHIMMGACLAILSPNFQHGSKA